MSACFAFEIQTLTIPFNHSETTSFDIQQLVQSHSIIQTPSERNNMHLRCASFSNLPMVAEMPRPISAAFLAKSDLLTRPSPFAADFCASLSSDFRCALALFAFWRRCAWARTDLNSAVRSWIDATAILRHSTVLYPGLRPARLVWRQMRFEALSVFPVAGSPRGRNIRAASRG